MTCRVAGAEERESVVCRAEVMFQPCPPTPEGGRTADHTTVRFWAWRGGRSTSTSLISSKLAPTLAEASSSKLAQSASSMAGPTDYLPDLIRVLRTQRDATHLKLKRVTGLFHPSEAAPLLRCADSTHGLSVGRRVLRGMRFVKRRRLAVKATSKAGSHRWMGLVWPSQPSVPCSFVDLRP